MNQQQAILIVKDIIQGSLRHKNYSRTVEKATKYKRYITGEGIDKEMQKFGRREDDEAFKQRVLITSNITETVCANLIDPQYKLPRSNSIEKRLSYVSPDNKKYDEITRILSNFWENSKSVDDYMSKAWIELNNIDPNAFVAIDWKTNFNGERIKPYPVEYLSEQVYHFNKTNGDLTWVCVHRDEDLPDPEMYILYAKDFTVIFARKKDKIEWTDKKADLIFYKQFPIEDFGSESVGVLKSNDDYYDIYLPQPHNLNKVPGFFVGFVTDLATRTSYLSFIHKAIPILKKVVKVNSELDLTMALHTFPQKVQYVNPCPKCHGNRRTVEGTECGYCKGSGVDPESVHKSAQDVMEVPRPRDKEDLFDLSKLVYYVDQDVELPKFQEATLARLTKWCKEAVYNSEVFSRGNVAETAYAKNLDLQNVYDALWPMAQAYALTYNFIVGLIAEVTDLNEGLIHNLSFRKDFKMKSLTDLYADLEIIGRSGVSDEFVKVAVEDDIAEVLYEDDPRELLKYKTKKYFFPFSGKTKDEIKLCVTSPRLVPEKIRVLWANFSYILDELEQDFKKNGVDFYRIPREKQREAINKKVDELIEQNKEQEEINVGGTLQAATPGVRPPVGQAEEEAD
jgi:hypothetical protein